MTTSNTPTERDVGSCLAVYGLSDENAQQILLDDFRTAAMAGVSALGVDHPQGPRIIFRCTSAGDEVLVDHVVCQIDSGAHRLGGEDFTIAHPSVRPRIATEERTP